MTKRELVYLCVFLMATGTAGVLGVGCASMSYSNTSPDGSVESYRFREPIIPGIKLDARRGDVHTEINADGSSLFTMGREEEGLDTTGQLQMIIGLANLIAGGVPGTVPTDPAFSPQPTLPPASIFVEELLIENRAMRGTISSLRAAARTYRIYGRRGPRR